MSVHWFSRVGVGAVLSAMRVSECENLCVIVVDHLSAQPSKWMYSSSSFTFKSTTRASNHVLTVSRASIISPTRQPLTTAARLSSVVPPADGPPRPIEPSIDGGGSVSEEAEDGGCC